MINSILIANRGEIACRIIKTAKAMGIETIAVYSEADKNALHVRQADRAVSIGAAAAAESYLVIERLVEAARISGADAVHPGYGFLSENTEFAAALKQAGIIFIGPHATAIAKMGDKIESKRLAEKAGVPGVPGYSGNDQSDAALISAALEIGFPVMVKASAGGGGKGMRRVYAEQELGEAIKLARLEAKASFGDERLLVEKLIQNPRHLEVQLAGDKHGNIIHLFERDCSVQRNNQKILEEAPAPNLSDAVRQKLFERAIKLARAIEYDSLGTVEFIMDAADDEPAFLEMNTRLQVEHPVTEFVTGLDLVELQIRSAIGEALPYQQDQICLNGHAIEARLTAEAPARNFAPVTGRIESILWPCHIRIDSGVAAGSEITPFYDSMIAKVISYGTDRASAVAKLTHSLSQTAIFGIETNISFLIDCLSRDSFKQGLATTKFLEIEFPDGWPAPPIIAEDAAKALALWFDRQTIRREDGFASLRVTQGADLCARCFLTAKAAEGEVFTACLTSQGEAFSINIGDDRFDLSIKDGMLNNGHVKSHYSSYISDKTVYIAENGRQLQWSIAPQIEFAANTEKAGLGSGHIKCDMPGTITDILVTKGEEVAAGTPIITMESMKLLMTLSSDVAGRVSELHAATGDLVNAGDVLAIIEETS
ncbi:MAG: acetyl/propionyl/methylcrotonyl-CoA carboxylase subunit alpha [bacterium]